MADTVVDLGGGFGSGFSLGFSTGECLQLSLNLPTPSVNAGESALLSALGLTLDFPIPAVLAGTIINVPVLTVVLGTPLPTINTGVSVITPMLGLRVDLHEPRIGARPHTFIAATNTRTIEEVFVILVTISHANLATPIRIANDTLDELDSGVRGVISNGNEFIYLPFQFLLPNLERDNAPRARIVIDNITREIVAQLDPIRDPPEVRIQIALNTDPDII